MAKQALIKQDGTILEALSNAMFRVKLENGHEILATISGKIKSVDGLLVTAYRRVSAH